MTSTFDLLRLLFHPVWQGAFTLLTLYVLYLGYQRFRFNHLGQTAEFKWKRHVTLGLIAMGAMLAGLVGGYINARITWPGVLITGLHGYVGLAMIPFLILGAATGWFMDRRKKRRKALSLIHGLIGLLVIVMSLAQAYTGVQVYRFLVMGF